MQAALIVIIVINLVMAGLLFYLLRKSNTDQSIKESMNAAQGELYKTLLDVQERQKHYQSIEFESLRNNLSSKLGEGLDKSQKALSEVLQRMAKVDEAQKNIGLLGTNITQLQNVLTDKKSRGIFGEIQLKNILENVFGSTHVGTYELQKSLSNGKIVDAVIYLPEPVGMLCIDSKFPLENYKKIVDEELGKSEREVANKEFSKNFKKHIDDISSKYILEKETASYAVLFLPAEAIFSHIHAYKSELIEYAAKKQVWPCSPTTMMATLSTVQIILQDMKRSEHLDEIHEQINKLGVEFVRHEERWDELSKHLKNVTSDVDKINITQRKIRDRFHDIMDLDSAQS